MRQVLLGAALFLGTGCNFLPVFQDTDSSLLATCDTACNAGETCTFGKCICDPATCKGCCAAERCLVGTEREACGKNGSICDSCTAEAKGPVCIDQQCKCASPTQCEASLNGPFCLNDGCACVNEQSCPDGQACAAGNKCRAQGCDAAHPCRNGCCTLLADGSTGVCVAADQCAGGVACGNDHLCPAMCDAQHPCVSGCCNGGVCVSGMEQQFCGADGGACKSCGDSQACDVGICKCDDDFDCELPQRCDMDSGTCLSSCDSLAPCNGGCCDNGQCVLATASRDDALQCMNTFGRPYCVYPIGGGPPDCACRSNADCGDLVCDLNTGSCSACSPLLPCGGGALCSASTGRCIAASACDGCRNDAQGFCYSIGWLNSSYNTLNYCGHDGGVCAVVGTGQHCDNGVVKCSNNDGCNGTMSGPNYTPICDAGNCRMCIPNSADCGADCQSDGRCVTCTSGNCKDSGGTCQPISAGDGHVCGSGSGACVTCSGGAPICHTDTARCAACTTSSECNDGKCLGENVGGALAGACVNLPLTAICKTGNFYYALNPPANCRDGAGNCAGGCSGTAPYCDLSSGCRACQSNAECGAGNLCLSSAWGASGGSCVAAASCDGCNDGTFCQPGTVDSACGRDAQACQVCAIAGCISSGPNHGLCPNCNSDADCVPPPAPGAGCNANFCSFQKLCKPPSFCVNGCANTTTYPYWKCKIDPCPHCR